MINFEPGVFENLINIKQIRILIKDGKQCKLMKG